MEMGRGHKGKAWSINPICIYSPPTDTLLAQFPPSIPCELSPVPPPATSALLPTQTMSFEHLRRKFSHSPTQNPKIPSLIPFPPIFPGLAYFGDSVQVTC